MDPVKPVSQPIRIAGGDAQLVKWEGLTLERFEGEKVEMHPGLGRTVQVAGDFAGATLVVETSLDGNYWDVLMEIDEPKMETVYQDSRYVRPKLLGATKKTNLMAILMVRRLS